MTEEKAEISEHMVRVYRWLAASGRWATAKEIASGAGVAERTARAHCQRLVRCGVFDQAEVFPGHRYRVSTLAGKRNKAFMLRLRDAEVVFANEVTK